MSDDVEVVEDFAPAAPVIDLRRIRRIRTYEVMDHELESLDHIVAAENQALGFCAMMLGVFVSLIGSFGTAGTLTATRTALYTVFIVNSGLATVWFFFVWRRAAKRRPKLLAEIREHTAQTEALMMARRSPRPLPAPPPT